MGASSSKDLDEPLIGYKMPSDRSRVRSMRSYLPPGSTGPSFDPGFDGYDFLIIFARPGHVVDGRSGAAPARSRSTNLLPRVSAFGAAPLCWSSSLAS